MPINLHHPHDAFFKKCLEDPTTAKDLLQAQLPKAIAQRIDWHTLQRTNKSYVNEELRQLHSDVVYQCQLSDKPAYVYCVLEHQSTPDPLLPFRILQYNVALMAAHLRQKKEQRLPLIANVCLYAGQQAPYPHSVDLYDCFERPDLARAVMFKPLALVDLTTAPPEALQKLGNAAPLGLLLKQAQERAYLQWLKKHPETLRKLLEQYGQSALLYILATERKHSAAKITAAISEIAPHKKEDIMTAAMQLHNEGMKQGRQEGMEKGIEVRNFELARTMLQDNTPLAQVAKWTGIAPEQLAQLRS